VNLNAKLAQLATTANPEDRHDLINSIVAYVRGLEHDLGSVSRYPVDTPEYQGALARAREAYAEIRAEIEAEDEERGRALK